MQSSFFVYVKIYLVVTRSWLLHCQMSGILIIQQLTNRIHVKFLHCHLIPSSKREIHYVTEALNRGSLFASQTVYAVTQLSGFVTNIHRCNACIHSAPSGSDVRQCTGHLLQDWYRHHMECNTNVATPKTHTHTFYYEQKYLYICYASNRSNISFAEIYIGKTGFSSA